MKRAALDRRHMLAGLGLAAASILPGRIAYAANVETERRMVFIIQRGAADGLHTLAPIRDPAYAGVRGALAEDFSAAPKLDATFALHPALPELGKLYSSKQALFLHAAASPYRERSHFDGQNVLETLGANAYTVRDGWLNRLLGLMPGGIRGIAVGPTVPMAMRGPREVSSYGESALPQADSDIIARVSDLYSADAQFHALWASALQTRGMATAGDAMTGGIGNGQNPAELGKVAARLLLGPAGARIAMIESDGWDTHFNQRARLTQQLRGLDAMIGALRDVLGQAWASTLVIVATEFGRMVAVNGTGGTDHRTASAALLLGGAVKGGRIVADWPGLAPSQQLETRDLRPTLSLDAALAGAIGEHFSLDPAHTLTTLFPGASGRPMTGLI